MRIKKNATQTGLQQITLDSSPSHPQASTPSSIQLPQSVGAGDLRRTASCPEAAGRASAGCSGIRRQQPSLCQSSPDCPDCPN